MACREVPKVVATSCDGPGMSRHRSYMKTKKIVKVGVQHSRIMPIWLGRGRYFGAHLL